MIASISPQVLLWIETPTKLTFPPCALPTNYHEIVHESFSKIVMQSLNNVVIHTDTRVTIERSQSDQISNRPRPFTEQEIAAVIASMLYVSNIRVSLPGVNCEIVQPFVDNKSAEGKRRNMKSNGDIYNVVQPKLDTLWYINP